MKKYLFVLIALTIIACPCLPTTISTPQAVLTSSLAEICQQADTMTEVQFENLTKGKVVHWRGRVLNIDHMYSNTYELRLSIQEADDYAGDDHIDIELYAKLSEAKAGQINKGDWIDFSGTIRRVSKYGCQADVTDGRVE